MAVEFTELGGMQYCGVAGEVLVGCGMLSWAEKGCRFDGGAVR
ncbi:hypothetical protein PJE062_4919 [Pseudovibrio sp. JE062]|nr:hypothetical protein PJE062_4919 [Pseudovibrio sp. JE062]